MSCLVQHTQIAAKMASIVVGFVSSWGGTTPSPIILHVPKDTNSVKRTPLLLRTYYAQIDRTHKM